jgi:diguanylate cyclase (GGDEF)-like protein/PAS domain S-box-containing protein
MNSSSIDLSQDTILLVDDMPENISLVYQFLKQHNFSILIAQDGHSALDIANKEELGLILLDVMMPGMNGFELCERLKQNPHTHDVPVIFMTALSETADKLKGFAVGGVDYLGKPVQEDELLARVNTHLHLFHLQKMLSEKNSLLEQALASHEAMLHNSLVGIAFMNQQQHFIEINDEWQKITGHVKEDLIGVSLACLYPMPEEYFTLQQTTLPMLHQGEIYESEHQLKRADGSIFWGRLRGKAINPYNPTHGFIWNLEDISRRKIWEDDLRLAAKVFENIGEALMVCAPDTRIIRINPAFTELTGYSEQEIIGKKPNCLSSGYHDKEFYQDVWNSLHQQGQWQGELWDKRKNGQIFPTLSNITAVRRPDGQISNYVAVMSDITERKRAEEELTYHAHYDKLTGLPNRRLFLNYFHNILHQAELEQQQLALIYADLDGFKQINDDFGHEVGDKVLEEVARRLKQSLREHDMAARWGGDEFVILLSMIKQEAQVEIIVQRLIQKLNFKVACTLEYNLPLSVSVGIVLYPTDADNAEDLLRRADNAMYRAKQGGKNTYCRANHALPLCQYQHSGANAELPIIHFGKP